MIFIKPGCLITYNNNTCIVISIIDSKTVVIQDGSTRVVTSINKIAPIGHMDIKTKSIEEISQILSKENKKIESKHNLTDFERFKKQLEMEVENMVVEEMIN